MQMKLAVAAVLAWGALAGVAAADVKSKAVEYTVGGVALQGYLAWDDAATGKRPGVVVVHEWWGLDDRIKGEARKLAEAGYVAFAPDMYGKGKVAAPTHPKDAEAFMGEATKDPAVVGARFAAGLEQLKKDPHVDPTKIGAIGYCFGGMVVLEAARAGADLKAVVSLHGMLGTKSPAKQGAIKGQVLVLTGAADPMVPASQVDAFEQEMAAAGAPAEVTVYPGVKHAFTNPNAGKAGMPALEYNADAATKSWAATLAFLKKTLA